MINLQQDKIAKQSTAAVRFADAIFPAPFAGGLEYSSPARGMWNIVHTGMLIPQAHQIFVCAQGCLRGVVLTAAEMGASHRFSTIAVREDNVLSGNNEELIIEGVTDILNKLPKKPRAVLIYTSCMHHFIGCDLPYVYNEIRKRFPDIRFTDCYMNPIMRKSGTTPDSRMRMRLYSLLDKYEELDEKAVNLAGCDLVLDKDCELYSFLYKNGIKLCEVANTKSFDEYLDISKAKYCITTFPAAIPAGKELNKKFGQMHLHLPFSFDYDEINKNYRELFDTLKLEHNDFSSLKNKCENALSELYGIIGNTPIVIDYTSFTRPLSLALLLLSHSFNVTKIYADSFSAEEKEDFDKMKELYPDVLVYPTVDARMRIEPRASETKTLAIGQKAAYFCDTEYFVNIVENGGYYGYQAILNLCRDMLEAYNTPKDTRRLIQVKGMGCCCI